MRVFLWMLREAGVQDVPSFALLRKIQSQLRTEGGIPTHQYESVQGNTFFMNDLQKIISKVAGLFLRCLSLMSIFFIGLRKPSCPSTPPLLS